MKIFLKKLYILVIVSSIAGLAFTSYRQSIHGEVVCFGDSITHGAHVNGHSWVYFLNQEHHNGVNFINEGRNGRKTSDKLELLPVLKKYPHADYYLIFLGVNDLKNGNAEMVNHCVENMKWMISKIHEADAKAKIVILAPSDINLKTMSGINVRKKYNENTKRSLVELELRYKKLAKEENLGFISLLHSVSKPNYVDGLHPDIKGQKQLAATVWHGLNQLY